MSQGSAAHPILKRTIVVLLVPYGLWLVFAYRYHFIDGVNLVFHEAGHVFFGVLGDTMHFIGGSLGQLLFPAACALYFSRKQQKFEAYVCRVWLGESMMYLATYMADAKIRALPLVGGHIHDWHWLFAHAGLLDSSRYIGGVVRLLAVLLVIYSIWRLYLLGFCKKPANPANAGT